MGGAEPSTAGGLMRYRFLVDTYASERLKTLNVWSMFSDEDLWVRPHPRLSRDRTPGETWFTSA